MPLIALRCSDPQCDLSGDSPARTVGVERKGCSKYGQNPSGCAWKNTGIISWWNARPHNKRTQQEKTSGGPKARGQRALEARSGRQPRECPAGERDPHDARAGRRDQQAVDVRARPPMERLRWSRVGRTDDVCSMNRPTVKPQPQANIGEL
jgi:hypothetical protein